jgi:hypothetical protein
MLIWNMKSVAGPRTTWVNNLKQYFTVNFSSSHPGFSNNRKPQAHGILSWFNVVLFLQSHSSNLQGLMFAGAQDAPWIKGYFSSGRYVLNFFLLMLVSLYVYSMQSCRCSGTKSFGTCIWMPTLFYMTTLLLTPFRSAKYSRRTGGGALCTGADGPRAGPDGPRPGARRGGTLCAGADCPRPGARLGLLCLTAGRSAP